MTPCPETVASASGVTKRAAFGVRMTRTSAPTSRRRRTRSGVLYAAIPPLTPSTTLIVGRGRTACAHFLLRDRRRLFHRRRELPFHLVPLDLFHRHARRLGVFRARLRRRSLNELLGALRHQKHVAELAVNALGQTFH